MTPAGRDSLTEPPPSRSVPGAWPDSEELEEGTERSGPSLSLGFRTRLFVTSVLLMLMFAAASSAWLELSLRPLLDEQAVTELGGAATLAREGLSRHQGDSSEALTDRLRALSEVSDMRLTVIASDGQVVADSSIPASELHRLDWHGDRPEVVAALAGEGAGVARRHSDTLNQDMLYVAVPLEWSGSSRGILRVARTTARADTPVLVLYRLLGFATVGGFLVALFMTWLAASTMNRDLGVLLQHTTALARGEARAPLQLRHHVELAGIAGTINQLAHEAQRSVRALAEERRRSAIVLGAVREGLLSIDRENRLTLVNPACEELLGITERDLGRQIEKAVVIPDLLALIHTAQRDGRATGDVSGVSSTLDGSREPRVLQAHLTGGEEGGIVISVHDITHVRRLETVRRDFVANVSHELRTPISIVQASAEALQDGAIDQPRFAAQFLDAILRNTDRLGLLVSDILQLSRIEAGHDLLDLEPVLLSEVVEDVVQILYTRSTDRDQTVISLVDSDVLVVADAVSLEQILVNLLDNAMKYTPKGGTITVSSVVENSDRVRVLVADNGPGIARVHHSRLFERFYRVDAGRARSEGGTGLGLAIVKHLAESMDGSVGYEANTPTGSVFWVELSMATDLELTEDRDAPAVDSPTDEEAG